MSRPVVNTIVSGPKYAPSTYQTIVLKSNQDFKAVVESEPNKKYIIKYDYDLGGETVTMPEGCLIEMDGGTISNGTMVGDHTILIYFQDYEDCIKSVTMQGTWKYNNPRDGIMTENIYDENLDETQKQFNARVNEALEEVNRRAQAVIPLPDEEDLTTDSDHNIKLKNKAYAPAQFSGLGKTYLRKNIVEIALPFDGFVEDVTLESEGLTSAPVAIFFDSTNGIFVGIDNLLNPKYYGTWLDGSAYNTEGTLADDDEFKNTSDDTYYKYDDGALVSISTPTTKNILTQEMMPVAEHEGDPDPGRNTIYIIQYDYDLMGETIDVPDGCTLSFDGGSLSNGKIVFDNTYIDGTPKILCDFEGTVSNVELNIFWFGIEPNLVVSQQVRLQKIIDLYSDNVPGNPWDINLKNPEPCILIPNGIYIFGNISLRSYLNIKGEGRSNTLLKNTYFSATSIYNSRISDLSMEGPCTVDSERSYEKQETDKCAVILTSSARLIFRDVVIRNYDIAVYSYNSYLIDFVDCYICYCSDGFLLDGQSGSSGAVFNIIRGEIANCNYAFTRKDGVTCISVLQTCFESNTHCVYNLSNTVLDRAYFEANGMCIEGDAMNGTIINCSFMSNLGYIVLNNSRFSKITNNLFASVSNDVNHITIVNENIYTECYANDRGGTHDLNLSGITNKHQLANINDLRFISIKEVSVSLSLHQTSGKYYGTKDIYSEVSTYGKLINMYVKGGSIVVFNDINLAFGVDNRSIYVTSTAADDVTIVLVFSNLYNTIQNS